VKAKTDSDYLREYARLLGGKLTVGFSDDLDLDLDLTEIEYAICIRASEEIAKSFTNNIAGQCADCGVDIVWRPCMPDGPVKICIRCAVARQRRVLMKADLERQRN